MDVFSITDWKKGEVIFVIFVVLGIFGISYYQLKIGEMKTRDQQRKADVSLISRGLRKYFDDYKVYPMEATGEGKIVSCKDKGLKVCEWGEGPMVDGENVVYLNKVPRDPLGDKGYRYVYEVDDQRLHFKVYAGLEYKGDSGYKKDLTKTCGNNVQCSWYVQE